MQKNLFELIDFDVILEMHQSSKDGSEIQKYPMNDAQMDHNPNMHQTSRNASKSKNASKFEEMVQKRFKIKHMHQTCTDMH